jgi:hypothetical protein
MSGESSSLWFGACGLWQCQVLWFLCFALFGSIVDFCKALLDSLIRGVVSPATHRTLSEGRLKQFFKTSNSNSADLVFYWSTLLPKRVKIQKIKLDTTALRFSLKLLALSDSESVVRVRSFAPKINKIPLA